MKKLLLLSLPLLLACSKDDDNPTPGGSTNTITKVCHMTESKQFDASGNLTGTAKYYFTSGKIDSSVAYNAQGVYSSKVMYVWNSGTERVATVYGANRVKLPGKSIQTLDGLGNVIEIKGYDDNNALTSRSTYTFDCD